MSSKILLLPVEVSSSLLLILLSMYQWRAAVSWDAVERTWLLQPFFVLGKTRTKQGHPKLLHIFSLHTPKEKVLWWSSWRSSSCHRGGWIQAAWGHWKAKHWRWWAGHLCRLSNTFMNAPGGCVVGYFEPDPNCWSKWLLAAPPSRHWLSAKRDTQSLLIHMRPCVPPEASPPFLYIVCRVQPGAPTHPKAAATFNRSPD